MQKLPYAESEAGARLLFLFGRRLSVQPMSYPHVRQNHKTQLLASANGKLIGGKK
jgi:hypothetical protein